MKLTYACMLQEPLPVARPAAATNNVDRVASRDSSRGRTPEDVAIRKKNELNDAKSADERTDAKSADETQQPQETTVIPTNTTPAAAAQKPALQYDYKEGNGWNRF